MSDTPSKPLSYRDAGGDIDAGNALVERIKPLVARHPPTRSEWPAWADSRPVSTRRPALPIRSWFSGTDGVGTKLLLARQLERHDTIGIDLVAMCVNDILVCGRRTVVFSRLLCLRGGWMWMQPHRGGHPGLPKAVARPDCATDRRPKRPK